MGRWLNGAKATRTAMNTASEVLSDADASRAVEIYPLMLYDGSLIKSGTRINWYGQLKRAAVDLWDREENDPDHAAGLWENVDYKEGYRIIPDTITVGLAFANGEKGWWKDLLYKSLLDANTYTPEQYPAGWELAENEG